MNARRWYSIALRAEDQSFLSKVPYNDCITFIANSMTFGVSSYLGGSLNAATFAAIS